MHLLQVSGIRKKDERGFELGEISFTQMAMQHIAIAGETGSGKSTLLKIIGGYVQQDSGEVLFESRPVIGPAWKLIPGHPGIAYLSQQFELPNHLRVEQVLEYANELTPAAANKIFELCRIAHLLKRRTNQLSGGERQRIAIARLLIGSPRLFLLDEPFSNMDMIHKTQLQQILQDLGDQLRMSFIMVSHDPLEILSWADEVLIMQQGKLVQQGPPQELYHNPMNEYVAGLLGIYNLIPSDLAKALNFPFEGPEHKKLFLRPENIWLLPASGGLPKGVVSKTNFFGNFDEVHVSVMGTVIHVRTDPGRFEKGDEVNINIAPNTGWVI